MAGTKRAAEESSGQETERVSKVSKTTKRSGASGGKGAAKNGSKAAANKPKFTPDEFKAKALPLHVMLTHTPPSILKEGLIEEDGTEEKSPPVAESATSDIGLVGSLTLIPSSFSTGSYGWKGSKRVTVELQAGEVGPDGTREKVQVMLSINATVLGSKPEKKGAKGKKEDHADDDNGEQVEDDSAEVAEELDTLAE